VTLDNMLRSMM